MKVAQRSLEILKWLHENRQEGYTTMAMDTCVTKDAFEVLLFLHEHHSEGCSDIAVNLAAGSIRPQQCAHM
uniref:Uncharacterized protein n=1 Tax=Globisporangium ultimum (strain ATCC 200006 / CBS 805.95 / DAOM BR144) TaxID=431595 RepID=K3WL14_GLOUD